MLANPYEPPTADQVIPATDQRSALRLLFCCINFAISAFFFISAVIGVVAANRPGDFLGGLFSFVPLLVYSLSEWLALYRRRVTIERKLAYANLVCAAFVAFGVIANVGEVLSDERPVDFTFLLCFTGIGGVIVAYLITCGWCRLRWTRPVVRLDAG